MKNPIEVKYRKLDTGASVRLHIDGEKHDPFAVLERTFDLMFPKAAAAQKQMPDTKRETSADMREQSARDREAGNERPSDGIVPSSAPAAASREKHYPLPNFKPKQTALF